MGRGEGAEERVYERVLELCAVLSVTGIRFAVNSDQWSARTERRRINTRILALPTGPPGFFFLSLTNNNIIVSIRESTLAWCRIDLILKPCRLYCGVWIHRRRRRYSE